MHHRCRAGVRGSLLDLRRFSWFSTRLKPSVPLAVGTLGRGDQWWSPRRAVSSLASGATNSSARIRVVSASRREQPQRRILLTLEVYATFDEAVNASQIRGAQRLLHGTCVRRGTSLAY